MASEGPTDKTRPYEQLCPDCGERDVKGRFWRSPMNHQEMSLAVDYYRTALGWKQIFESGPELDEPQDPRRRR